MKKAFIVLTAIVVTLTLLLAGCSGKKSEATKVRIGEVTRSIFYAPQYVAITNGFFKDEGLDVELTTTPGGDKTMSALLSGNIDVALVGSETSVYVSVQGSDDPIINFAQLTQTDGTFLISRAPIDNFDWNMLKGSKFLGQRKGGMPQMAGEFVLKKHGIDPHNDLELIQNVEFANIVPAFTSGDEQFVQLFEPSATMLEQQGKGYVVASFGTESGHLPYTAYMTKSTYMKKNADTVQKFTNAVYRGQLWVQEHSVNEIADAVAPFFPDTDIELIRGVVKRYKDQGSFATDPIIDSTEWANLQDIMMQAGELKEAADFNKLVDNSYAEKAIKEVK
ncbi:NitT/TauT family transport system substrate-binding protein [Paenibacillus taihuensis]|uniref:NitT/TauT family transport system substrate-binding protein n=1 Tax=Paenibacillus taihuensis TaxID=1156355 RepID=A0A3D9QVJ5_9BACL|nr:NitT/TauT family transport system substrate-binding protein [Paenibacillus taihuensis]